MIDPIRALVGASRPGPRGRRSIVDLVEGYLRGTAGAGATTPGGAFRIATVYACVALIADAISTLPLKVYRWQGPDGGRAEVDGSNSLVQVLNRPNAYQDSGTFRGQLTAHCLLRGNAYAWIDWVPQVINGQIRDQAVGLYPMDPDRVQPIVSEDGRSLEYEFRRESGGVLRYPAEEILHMRGLSWDGRLGISVLEVARESFGVALSTQRYAGAFWSNDATPGVVLRHPGRLSDEIVGRVRDQWDALHADGQARKTAVLEDGMTLERLTVTAEDSQFLQTRAFQRSEIASWFRVPPHMIGDVEKTTSWGAGIEQQNLGFLSHTLRPWLVRWEQAIRRSLIVNERAIFAEHVLEGLLRADVRTRYGAYAQGRLNGWLSVNEIRRLENLDPIGPAGDTYVQGLNLGPLGGAPAGPDDPAAAAAGGA